MTFTKGSTGLEEGNMNTMWRVCGLLALLSCLLLSCGQLLDTSQAKDNQPGFAVQKMSDMSDFDPNNPVIPTGDTIKVGVLLPFSGPAAQVGEVHWCSINWVAHDINKRGGITVDGKKKKIQLIKGDTMVMPSATQKAAEKLCVEDKVDVLWGTNGSHLTVIIQSVAKKYKKILLNCMSYADTLMDGKNFNPYVFQTTVTTHSFGSAAAYYYAKRPEKKFYIICQDYVFGHAMAKSFKDGLKKFKPDAQIVGEDYHPFLAKDYAPYLEKIKASGAEVIYTADWPPDGNILLKQARQMGIKLPFANVFINDPVALAAVGPEGGVGLVNIDQYMSDNSTPEQQAFSDIWLAQWKKWKAPYNSILYKWPAGSFGLSISSTYWLFDVIERARSTDPEKIIKVWEGDEWRSPLGILKMRACDHRVVRDMYASEYVYPNPWFEECASVGKMVVIPASEVATQVPQDLDRCAGERAKAPASSATAAPEPPKLATFENKLPAFSLVYPGDWKTKEVPSPKVLRAAGSGGLPVLQVIVNDLPKGMKLADGAKGLVQSLNTEFPGADAKIVYEKDVKLSDGTVAFECEAEWKFQGAMSLNTYDLFVFKDNKLVSIALTCSGAVSDDVKKIAYSVKFK